MDTPERSVQEMPKWVRRYAQNQTIPLMVGLSGFAILAAAIGGFSYLAGVAYRAGQRPAFVLCLVAVAIAVAANTWFSVPAWGGRWVTRVGQRLSSEEGQVRLGSCRPARAMRVVGYGFGLGLAAFIAACFIGWVSEPFMQPVSALVLVPFMLFLTLAQRPQSGYAMLIWPGLYAAHAILILAGAPILFEGRWSALNMLIPTIGYGALSAAAAYLYSRYALRRLKRLAQEPAIPEGEDRG